MIYDLFNMLSLSFYKLFIFNIFFCTVWSLAFYFTCYLYPFLWNILNDFVLCTLHLQQLSARNKPDLGWRCSKLKLSLCVAVYVSFKCTPCIWLCVCVCVQADKRAECGCRSYLLCYFQNSFRSAPKRTSCCVWELNLRSCLDRWVDG